MVEGVDFSSHESEPVQSAAAKLSKDPNAVKIAMKEHGINQNILGTLRKWPEYGNYA